MKKNLTLITLFLVFKTPDGTLAGLLTVRPPANAAYTAVKVSDDEAPSEGLIHFLRDNWASIRLVGGKVQVTRQKAVVQEVTEEPADMQVKP